MILTDLSTIGLTNKHESCTSFRAAHVSIEGRKTLAKHFTIEGCTPSGSCWLLPGVVGFGCLYDLLFSAVTLESGV